jgi:hypothetical protein
MSEIWDLFYSYESLYGDLGSIKAFEKRQVETYPNSI